MQMFPAFRLLILFVVSGVSLATMTAQSRKEQPTAGCPPQPSTLRAMRNCYRPLMVFAPAMNDPQLMAQFNQLKAQAAELLQRDVLYVPVVPEGHNQPVPGSRLHTASLSEDELAAVRHHFNVESAEFLVILIGKDGEEKLRSRTPVAADQLKRLIDSMPMRKREMQQQPQNEP